MAFRLKAMCDCSEGMLGSQDLAGAGYVAFTWNLEQSKRYRAIREPVFLALSIPKGPSTHYLRTLGPLWVPKTINKDYLDP